MEAQEEIKLQFLVSGSYVALPSSYHKLRSYLNIHSSNLADLHGLKLPKFLTKTNLTCQQCFLPWSNDTYSIKLLPVKKLRKSFSKSRIHSTKASPKLKVPKNHLVLNCKICKSKSHFYLPKIVKTTKTFVKDEIMVQRKKKKKKKDKMCGLHKSLKTSFKKCEPFLSSENKTNSSTLKPDKTCSSTANIKKNIQKNLQVKKSQSVSKLPARKIQSTIKNKNLFKLQAVKLRGKSSNKKNKKLQKLQNMIQREKMPVKKTLKDFLTLI